MRWSDGISKDTTTVVKNVLMVKKVTISAGKMVKVVWARGRRLLRVNGR